MERVVTSMRFLLLGIATVVFTTLLPVSNANADCSTNPASFINAVSHDPSSFCELCAEGIVRIVLNNTDSQALTNVSAREDLTGSGLEYVPGSTRISVNGGAFNAAPDPAYVLPSLVLTWTLIDNAPVTPIPDLISTHVIEYRVRAVSTGIAEDLVSASRQINASVTFDFASCTPPPFPAPPPWPTTTISTGPEILTLNEPLPVITKGGRNIDAGQGGYTPDIYGNEEDDVIWQINFANGGAAAMQDMKFNDLMAGSNMTVRYACPTEGAAVAIANNDGIDPSPGTSGCRDSGDGISNNITDFIVSDPFGEPGSPADIAPTSAIQIYLVGKINSTCSLETNTAGTLEWGCAVNAPAGGITAPSSGVAPAAGTATLSNFVNNGQLQVTQAVTGLNAGEDVGARGLVSITVTNNTGGTVHNITFRNTLPANYRIDPSFVPTINPTYAYGNYPGAVDTVNWTNPAGGSAAASLASEANFMANTAPEFELKSSTINTVRPVPLVQQDDLLRHGDSVTITFRIVLTNSTYYDQAADLDVTPETNPLDPAAMGNLTNTVELDYEKFCSGPSPTITNADNTISVDPEDIDISLSAPLYIITNDPAYPTPLTVRLTNNGGHTATDFTVYVSFGEAMTIDNSSLPTGCVARPAYPPTPRPVWPLPAPSPPPAIPASAWVYECSDALGMNAIGPNGAFVDLTFQATKNLATPIDDDLIFRADVIGEITLANGNALTYPTAPDPIGSLANNYSLDGVRSRVLGFNLLKSQVGACTEENVAPYLTANDNLIIGEECTYQIESGGWFGFQTPGFNFIAVRDVIVTDQLPTGQGFLREDTSGRTAGITAPVVTSTVLGNGTDVSWQFNGAGNEITVKDEYFRASIETRLLNDAIDSSAGTNAHASTSRNIAVTQFDALFDADPPITVDQNAGVPGYPVEAVRRVDKTVTEPNVTVVKEVCNETLSLANGDGDGPNCVPFQQTVTNGDANDTYVFRITLLNDQTGSALQRAPAYNIVATDTLASSDLMVVANFGSDNLDNDGDGLTDEPGEGTISDNIPNNGTPAVITFSHTHSAPLLRRVPSESATFYYRVDIWDTAAPEQTFTNTVVMSYDSLDGPTGNQTAPQLPNSDLGGARVYTTTPATATVEIIPVVADPKEILNLANTAPSAPTQPLSIGEEVEYRLTAQLPFAKLRQFTITDDLPVGMRCIEGQTIVLPTATYPRFSPGGTFAGTCSNNGTNDVVTWNFGDQELTELGTSTRYSLPVTFIARVNNSAGNNAGAPGTALNNGASNTARLTYYPDDTLNPLTLVTRYFAQVNAEVREPNIVLTKTFSAASTDAGDVLTVTVTATNTGNATAYNLRVLDDLVGTKMTYVNVGADPPSIVDTSLGANRPIFRWNTGDAEYAIAPGATIDFNFTVSVDVDVEPEEILSNTLQGAWQSLPSQNTALNTTVGTIGADGAADGMRNGSLPIVTGDVNDYETEVTTTIPVLPASIGKASVTNTYLGGPDVRIGDIVEYRLRLSLPEGTTNNIVLTDVLPAGLQFEGVVSVNGATTAPYTSPGPPFSYTAINAPVVSPADTVTWTLGTIVNAGDNLPNNDFDIVYRARVLNLVHPQVANIALTNTVTFTHDLGGAPAAPQVTTETINLLQPILAVSKSSAQEFGDAEIIANEVVTYTVDIANTTGTAPAYDTVLRDIIPVGQRNSGLTITVDSISLVVAGTSLPILNPVYDAGTGVAVWDFDTGGANTYTIPAGDTLRVVYRVQADSDISPALIMTNQAQVQNYYSFDDEAVPTLGSITGVREIYGPSNISTVTLTTQGPSPLTKVNPGPSVTIGETFTYRITVPGVAIPVALHDVVIVDDLATTGADLEFVSVTRVSGTAAWTPQNTGTATNLVIQDTGAGIEIPANTRIELDVTVRVRNTGGNDSTVTFANTAGYRFNQVDGDIGTQLNGGSDTTPAMQIVEPNLVMDKTGPVSGSVQFGQLATFTLDMRNSGSSRAWDVTVIDELPNEVNAGMCDTAPTNITARIVDTGGTPGPLLNPGSDYITSFTPAGAPGPGAVCTLSLTMQTTAASIGVNERLVVTYDAMPDNDNLELAPLTNVAAATEWFSLDTAGAGATGEIRTYTRPITPGDRGTPGDNTDHEDALTVNSEVPVLEFRKSVIDPGTGLPVAPSTASPGDTLRYQITVRNMSGFAVTDFSLTDELDRLNGGAPMFLPNTMTNPVVAGGTGTNNTGNSSATGGTLGTGLVDVQDIDLEANGGNDTVTITFDVTLQPVITNNTVVLNQAQIFIPNYVTLESDDPNVSGPDNPVDLTDQQPTETRIVSSPNMQVQKVSQDLTGDPAILDPGDTLRYTITVKNIGNENANGVSLRDQIPANSTYVANSTRLNGNLVADPSAGVSALESGMLINAPENTTPGFMRADTNVAANNVATITFDVTVNAGALPGTTISNQGFVNGDGAGSGAIPEQPSDDPSTALADDPTVDVVGNVPLIDAQKTVEIVPVGDGILNTGENIRYTFTITNSGAVAATNVVLTDPVPAGTNYNAGTTTLNAVPVPDGGTSPLVGGLAIGNLPVGGTATVTIEFNVTAASGSVITNQGTVTSTEQAPELTDSDGNSSNGNQPTQIAVGNVQQLAINKAVAVVGGGTVQPGSELEYTVQVTNIGGVPATNVVITDNLDNPVAGQVTYVPGSATLNAAAAGITEPAGVPQILTANYGATYSDLAPGATATLRFRVTVGALPIGTTITNIAQVDWDAGSNNTAQVSVDVGGTPGFANFNGNVWHDANFDNAIGGAELRLQNWTVEFYRNSVLVGSVVTDATGAYQMIGLPPNNISGDLYELRFVAPGAVATTASLGQADSATTGLVPLPTDGPQNISNIVVGSGSNTQNLNLPIDPSGVVYDSVSRVPVAGATLTMVNSLGAAVDNACFDDPAQQGQVTLATGYYKFDLDFTLPGCTAVAGGDYTIQVAPPTTGYNAAPSLVIPPVATTYVIPSCSPSDAIPATTNCEAQPSEFAPAIAAPTDHFLTVQANNPAPGDSQLFNNHIALDPIITGTGVTLTKTSPMQNVTRGSLVPYTITATNNLGGALNNNDIVDTMPPGFKYVAGSATINGVKVEPTITGRELRWPGINLPVGTPVVLKTLLIVGSGVGEGKYVNQVYVFNNILGVNASGIAEATVRVTADPTFDCSDVIGKVFDDRNGNGYQDPGEPGLPGARVVTAKGLLIDADKHGRYHITCAAVPNPDRGSNFILKLDTRSLPTGYRVTSENPRVVRLTRGKMGKINFGATIHRVVRLDLSDAAFEPVKPGLRPEWRESLKEVVEQLKTGPSILRLSYLGDAETNAMAKARIEQVREIVLDQWKALGLDHKLTIETELFWRRGSPGDGGRAPARDGMSFSHLDDNVVVSDIGENTEYLLPDANFTVWSSGKGEFELRDDGSVHFKRRVIEDITVENVPDRINPMSTVSGEPDIAATSVSRLKVLLSELSQGKRLRLHFTGYTDDQPLSEAAQQRYGDRVSMSRAQAKIAADYFLRELGLKAEQVTYDGKGSAEPLQRNDTTEGQLANRRVEARVWVEDVAERTVEEPEVVPQTGVKRVRVCRREPACIVVRKNKDARRMVVNRPVDPIRFKENTIKLASADIEQLRTVVNRYKDKPNWQLRFTGHVDSMPISRDAAARFGDKVGLSRAHARVVARQVQEALGLDNHQVVFEGAGDSAPLADNALPSGRARNRRVEVSLWFDAPEDVLSVSDPQVCPVDADGRDHVAERYLPGGQDPIGPVAYRNGKPVINDQYLIQLKGLLDRLQDKPNLRIVFAGYTESMLLNRRAAQAYGDNWGLAEARAGKVRDEIKAALNLPAEMLSIEGKGLDESGIIDQGRVLQSPEGYVDLEIWFDVPVPLDENIVAELIRIQRNTDPVNPFSLAPMRVTVDGKRLDASLPHGADVQRCTDVALEKTSIQLRYDGHQIDPKLTVLASPQTILHEDNPETAEQENLVAFQGYTNYPAMIDKAEIRLFRSAQSLDGTPHAVIKLDQHLRGEWAAKWSSEAEYKYLLRVYDNQGRFDETRVLPLHVVNKPELLAKTTETDTSVSKEIYGESMLLRRGIPMTGGTVTVNADAVPKGHQVWVMNKPVLVDASGKLVSQQIIPKGLHTVEVAVLDSEGNGQAYLRDLGMTHGNWFYTGIADVTMGMDQTSGPASLVTGDATHYNSGAYTDGRFAFYAKGSTRKGLEITAHADTEEGELGSLFSSIMDKRPQALFRRLDQDYEGYVYPTFGDDSKTTEDAPTQGKMYFKARKDNNFGLWGNFKAHWLDTDLARVDRGLYGAYGHYQSSKTTSFGEARTRTDTFVAEPGTVRGREDFRGTGGSLYFLRHQDITQGSESVWVEVRDQDSGLVLKTNKLVPGTDYTIDAIQGRVHLSAPLPSTADASQLVQAGSLSGHPVHLVVNYEYAPGLDELDSTTIGLRGSHWVNDSVKLGFTYHNEDQQNAPQNLTGVDLTWRKTAATYLKFETAATEGLGEGEFRSQDGGYTFGQVAPSTGPAKGGATRVEVVGQMQDFIANSRGRFTAYFQNREAGFSAPGQVTVKDTLQFGGSYNMKLDKFSDFNVKLDSKSEELGLSTQTLSADYGTILGGNWKMTAGVRHDSRDDSSAVVPTTQTEGDRTDAAVRMTYDKDEDWKAYYFAQATVQRTGTRNANNRLGGGGEYQVNDKLKLIGELSTGDLGLGAKFGADYKLNDNSNLYSTYALDNERDVSGLQATKGNFVTGFRAKTSESMSVYGEERYTHGNVPTGLTHAYGVELAPENDWRYGAAFELGSLRDPNTAAVMDRTALSLTAAHTNDAWRYSGAFEYRIDDQSTSSRTTYLLKNRLMYQTDPNWSLFGKFNYSDSTSTQGEFYDGQFIEAVFGYAFRPVDNDRWNTVTKYTYFHNLPAVDQLSGSGTSADYIQRSHVLALDTSYDLNKRWTIGGKLAYRMGELSMDRANPEFFSSRGSFYALRADWHVVHDWDITVEGRVRNELDAGDSRTGMLIGAYHHLGNNMKIGGGYNFADFSDDLTNMDYTTQGLFINIIGKF